MSGRRAVELLEKNKPRQERAKRTYERILTSAAELLVEVGETVAQGQIVARVGRTGNATAAHCHFEVRRDGVAMDPMRYLSRDVADRR